ncbi:hypothetical protein [Corynebacterium auris]|uniref:hypothetical protein n=1 Tax=Corynebacterium auris TaxID=44750 RepID=UPI0025B3E284|nr:hypothetical protein [Corynebacterium auris]WJY69109.1 hypothetical protein CAURIS_11215 [Corynebacterium auris]
MHGSGVFVGGYGDWEGQRDGSTIAVTWMTTGGTHTDGAAALTSGVVFVITGADVETGENLGVVTTYGQNDMVLDK